MNYKKSFLTKDFFLIDYQQSAGKSLLLILLLYP